MLIFDSSCKVLITINNSTTTLRRPKYIGNVLHSLICIKNYILFIFMDYTAIGITCKNKTLPNLKQSQADTVQR